MPQFMLILHEPPGGFDSKVSPEEVQRIVGEYSAWRQRLESEGRLVAGNKLKDEGGRQLSPSEDSSVRVVDGPYAETKEVVSGFFIVRADDYDEAIELSRSCPHLTYGSRIELRQLDYVD